MVVPVCRSLQFIQMFQPCQDDLFAGLFDLARKEDLVQNCINLHNEIPSAMSKIPGVIAPPEEDAPYRS